VQETRAFPRFARFSVVRNRCGKLRKSRVQRRQKTSGRRSRRLFSWRVAPATIVIWSSKAAQMSSSHHGDIKFARDDRDLVFQDCSSRG